MLKLCLCCTLTFLLAHSTGDAKGKRAKTSKESQTKASIQKLKIPKEQDQDLKEKSLRQEKTDERKVAPEIQIPAGDRQRLTDKIELFPDLDEFDEVFSKPKGKNPLLKYLRKKSDQTHPKIGELYPHIINVEPGNPKKIIDPTIAPFRELPVRSLYQPIPKLPNSEIPVFETWLTMTQAKWHDTHSGREEIEEPQWSETLIVKTFLKDNTRKTASQTKPIQGPLKLMWPQKPPIGEEGDLVRREVPRSSFEKPVKPKAYKQYNVIEEEPPPSEIEEVQVSKEEPEAKPKIAVPEYFPAVILTRERDEEKKELQKRLEILNEERKKEKELIDVLDDSLEEIDEEQP